MFQFTRPRGARQETYNADEIEKRFNSRARGGRDAKITFERYRVAVSIHAPAGGATPCTAPKYLIA